MLNGSAIRGTKVVRSWFALSTRSFETMQNQGLTNIQLQIVYKKCLYIYACTSINPLSVTYTCTFIFVVNTKLNMYMKVRA